MGLRKRGEGSFLNLLQKEGLPTKGGGGVPSKGGGAVVPTREETVYIPPE